MLRIGAVAFAVLAAGGINLALVRETAAADWVRYENERFGFRLDYPGDVFHVERTSDAGDGRVFASRGGEARLLVGALRNEDAHNPKSYQDFLARYSYADYKISYRPLGDNWLVLSGEANGKIFYEKATFSCDGQLINSFALIYPTDKRQMFEPIVAGVANSFVPGTKACKAPSEASARQRPVPDLHAYRSEPNSRNSGEVRASRETRNAREARRSPEVRNQEEVRNEPEARNDREARHSDEARIADRIARARGADVIVVLRRTSPPYDYKYVRGYAAR